MRYTGYMNDLLHWLLGAFCHQLPSRSLVAYGATLPLCARCTGLHVAAATMLLYLHLCSATRHRLGMPIGPAAWMLGGLAALWLADSVNSTATLLAGLALYPPSNTLRLFTGLGMGVCLGTILYPLLQDALSAMPIDLPIARRWADLPGPLLASVITVALVLLTPWETARSLLLTLSALTTLTVSNGLAVVALIPALRARHRGARGWFAALGLAAASIEIALLALAHAWLDR
jgi:uncharacterized membrane protein